jgi:UDP-glucose 4-epimerase
MSEESAYGNVFNVGATTEISMLDLAGLVIEVTGSSSDVSLIPYTEAYGEGFEDMFRRVPDTTKVQGLIGWAPTRSLEHIIRDVVEHQQQALAGSLPLTHVVV